MITKLTLDYCLYVARNMRENDQREVMATRWDDDVDGFALECFNLPGVSWVAINKDDEPVIIGGFSLNSPGIGTAWMVGTDNWLSVAVEVSHFCKDSIQKMLATDDIHRINAYSAAFHNESHRWLKLVGMQATAKLPQWGKKREDFILFEALKGDELCA